VCNIRDISGDNAGYIIGRSKSNVKQGSGCLEYGFLFLFDLTKRIIIREIALTSVTMKKSDNRVGLYGAVCGCHLTKGFKGKLIVARLNSLSFMEP
jgi:hypothetical protein